MSSASPSSTDRRRPRPLEIAMLAAVLAGQLALLLTPDRLPFQDLPLHLENASILADHATGETTALVRAFEAEVDPAEPNLLVYLILVPLLEVLPAEAAGRGILAVYLLAFPAAAWYAFSGFDRRSGWVTLAALPLSWSFLFTMGFLNFCFGVVAALVTVGYWARRRERTTTRDALVLAGLGLGTVFFHPVPFLFAAWIVGVGALVPWLGPGETAGPRLSAVAWRPLAALLPGLVVVLAFVLGGSGGGELARLSWATLATHFLTFNALVSFTLTERVAGIAYAAFLAGLALAAVRERPGDPRLARALLAATGGLGFVYFLAPAGIVGGGYLNPRLQLLAALGLLLWVASRGPGGPIRRWAAPAGAALALAFLAIQAPIVWRLGEQVAEAVSVGEEVPEGSSLAILSWAHRGVGDGGGDLSARSAPFQNLGGYLTAERGVVDLGNYQASQPYFPIRYRGPCDPFRRLWTSDLAEEPPAIDFAEWDAAGCRVDFLLLWARGERTLPDQVAAGWELVTRTASGRAELYRRR